MTIGVTPDPSMEEPAMCLNCGCGQLDTRHKETDLVRDDVQRAADGQGSSFEETVGNLERSLRELRAGSGSGAASRMSETESTATRR